MTIENQIDSYQSRAVETGDLSRALRINWLRNAVLTGQVSDDRAFWMLSVIHRTDLKDMRMGVFYEAA